MNNFENVKIYVLTFSFKLASVKLSKKKKNHGAKKKEKKKVIIQDEKELDGNRRQIEGIDII